MAFPRMLDISTKEPIPLPPSHKIGKGKEFLGMFAPLRSANIPKNPEFNHVCGCRIASMTFLENAIVSVWGRHT
jgi:hypothetical protein